MALRLTEIQYNGTTASSIVVVYSLYQSDNNRVISNGKQRALDNLIIVDSLCHVSCILFKPERLMSCEYLSLFLDCGIHLLTKEVGEDVSAPRKIFFVHIKDAMLFLSRSGPLFPLPALQKRNANSDKIICVFTETMEGKPIRRLITCQNLGHESELR